jgi:hypothetical protein
MGVLVFNTVGDGQMFKPEARQPSSFSGQAIPSGRRA